MSDSLGQLPWMTAPATRAVLDALEAAGGADCARFVGGCVRNALIGKPIADIDVATRLTPDAVTRALQAGGVRAIPTGIEHGTVTAVSHHQPIEVTTLRRDVETDGRRAVVAFTTDWNEDAQRRDFTLNSLYACRDGSLFDPTGHGVADARAGRIVFVGDPELRLREDHLRSLRFFRFLAWYGRGEPDAAAIAAITRLKDKVAHLAAERISAELLKLLAAQDPRPAVRLMAATGVLGVVLPTARDLARFEALVAIEAEQLFEADPLLRLAALLPDDPAEGVRTAERLRLSNAERDRLEAALAPPGVSPGAAPPAVRAAVYRLGVQTFRDRVKLAWAAAGGETAGWRGLLAIGEAWRPPALPVSGADVLAAGAPKGPKVGEALRALEAWWIAGDFAADRAAALAKLKELVA
ncbi:MAG: tRNA nucleotidyltransferase/poly(A) polymerase [Phenylobacterium sp.]|nr:tRNA nucleotidyltransferase/poly(A) polymerase [Phenylobacterium sp.]